MKPQTIKKLVSIAIFILTYDLSLPLAKASQSFNAEFPLLKGAYLICSDGSALKSRELINLPDDAIEKSINAPLRIDKPLSTKQIAGRWSVPAPMYRFSMWDFVKEDRFYTETQSRLVESKSSIGIADKLLKISDAHIYSMVMQLLYMKSAKFSNTYRALKFKFSSDEGHTAVYTDKDGARLEIVPSGIKINGSSYPYNIATPYPHNFPVNSTNNTISLIYCPTQKTSYFLIRNVEVLLPDKISDEYGKDIRGKLPVLFLYSDVYLTPLKIEKTLTPKF